MAIIKRKTVGDKTIRLHRAQTEKSGKQYEYYVTDDTDSLPLTRPVYTKKEGMNDFRQQVTEVDKKLAEQRGQQSFDSGGRSSSSSSRTQDSGQPSIPGLGGGMGGGSTSNLGFGLPAEEDDEDDDDDGPRLPFF